jgi:hypothetical protein
MLGLSPMIYQIQTNRRRGEQVKPETGKNTPNMQPNGNPKVQDRRMDALHPFFRPKIESWLNAARAYAKKTWNYTITVTETFRTPERQAVLFASNKPGHWVTDRTGKPGSESFHQFGVACDIMRVMPNGQADWQAGKYQALLKAVPLGKYGLETLAPAELVHIQLGAIQRTPTGGWLPLEEAFRRLKALGILPNVLVGSSYTPPTAKDL